MCQPSAISHASSCCGAAPADRSWLQVERVGEALEVLLEAKEEGLVPGVVMPLTGEGLQQLRARQQDTPSLQVLSRCQATVCVCLLKHHAARLRVPASHSCSCQAATHAVSWLTVQRAWPHKCPL